MEKKRRVDSAAWRCSTGGTKNRGSTQINIVLVLSVLLAALLLLLGCVLLYVGKSNQEVSLDVPETTPSATQVSATDTETTEPPEFIATEAPMETAVEETTTAPTEETQVPVTIPPESELYSTEEYLKVKPGENLFAVLPSRFMYGSGAGASGTNLDLYEDGTFDGDYHDSNMGDVGEGYKGSFYQCTFSGAFSAPKKISDYVYSVKLQSLNYPKDAGAEWIEDGVLCPGGTPWHEQVSGILYLPSRLSIQRFHRGTAGTLTER